MRNYMNQTGGRLQLKAVGGIRNIHQTLRIERKDFIYG